MVLFSMDAKVLYPSIQVERTGDAVYEVICGADVKYRNINVLELSRYLAVILECYVSPEHTEFATFFQ